MFSDAIFSLWQNIKKVNDPNGESETHASLHLISTISSSYSLNQVELHIISLYYNIKEVTEELFFLRLIKL